jgi:hypothetical protein
VTLFIHKYHPWRPRTSLFYLACSIGEHGVRQWPSSTNFSLSFIHFLHPWRHPSYFLIPPFVPDGTWAAVWLWDSLPCAITVIRPSDSYISEPSKAGLLTPGETKGDPFFDLVYGVQSLGKFYSLKKLYISLGRCTYVSIN